MKKNVLGNDDDDRGAIERQPAPRIERSVGLIFTYDGRMWNVPATTSFQQTVHYDKGLTYG